jgi:hypothetical protein
MTHQQASFHIFREGGSWVVVEESSGHEIGGIFTTLVAALDFVDGEARRFLQARAVIELSRRADTGRVAGPRCPDLFVNGMSHASQ